MKIVDTVFFQILFCFRSTIGYVVSAVLWNHIILNVYHLKTIGQRQNIGLINLHLNVHFLNTAIYL